MLYQLPDDAPRLVVRPKMTRRRKLTIAGVAFGVVAFGFLFAQHSAEQSTRDEIANVQDVQSGQSECLHDAIAAGATAREAGGTCFG